MDLKYCNCIFAPFSTKAKRYTFATDMLDLSAGMTVYYEKGGVLHELIFYEYCDTAPAGYHIKILCGRLVHGGYRHNCIVTRSAFCKTCSKGVNP
jgi:hypothetical protein